MKKVLKSSVWRYLLLGLLAATVGINIYIFNASRLGGDLLPTPFGYGAAVVLSGSMEPELSVGDLLIIHEQEQYGLNDIVAYQDGTMPVVHRIIALEGETVTTMGDANNVADTPIPMEAIKGKVVADIPYVGYVVMGLKKPISTILLVVLTILLVEGSVRRSKLEQEENKEKIKAEIRALKKELEEDET